MTPSGSTSCSDAESWLPSVYWSSFVSSCLRRGCALDDVSSVTPLCKATACIRPWNPVALSGVFCFVWHLFFCFCGLFVRVQPPYNDRVIRFRQCWKRLSRNYANGLLGERGGRNRQEGWRVVVISRSIRNCRLRIKYVIEGCNESAVGLNWWWAVLPEKPFYNDHGRSGSLSREVVRSWIYSGRVVVWTG